MVASLLPDYIVEIKMFSLGKWDMSLSVLYFDYQRETLAGSNLCTLLGPWNRLISEIFTVGPS